MILPRNVRVLVSPSRWNRRVWSTRSSFTWMNGSSSPISSRKTVPSGGQVSSQPARSSRAPVNAPRRWPNSSDSISVGDRAERFSAKKDWLKSPAKVLRLGVEGDVAGHGDGPGDQLLAGAGGAGDERGHVAHAVVEHPAVAAQVVGEDRLPDRRPQPGGGHRPAHDVVEDVVERPADLEVRARTDAPARTPAPASCPARSGSDRTASTNWSYAAASSCCGLANSPLIAFWNGSCTR